MSDENLVQELRAGCWTDRGYLELITRALARIIELLVLLDSKR